MNFLFVIKYFVLPLKYLWGKFPHMVNSPGIETWNKREKNSELLSIAQNFEKINHKQLEREEEKMMMLYYCICQNKDEEVQKHK